MDFVLFVFRVVKLIALEFVNNFLSLFYIAFWIGDLKLLSSQLMTQLIVFQVREMEELVLNCNLFYFDDLYPLLDSTKITRNTMAIDNAKTNCSQRFVYE